MNIPQGGVNPFMQARKPQQAGMALPIQPTQNVQAPQGVSALQGSAAPQNVSFQGAALPHQGNKLNVSG